MSEQIDARAYAARLRELAATHPDWPLNRVAVEAQWHGQPERTRRDRLAHRIRSLHFAGPRRPW